jgi:hypothetical protein
MKLTKIKLKEWLVNNIATIELLVVFAIGIFIGTLLR